MRTLRDYSKPLMVAEKFSADQYVAICTQGAQYLYLDYVRGSGTYNTGSDGRFQDASHVNSFWGWLLDIILRVFAGTTIQTDGEFTGIQTTANPQSKGDPYNDLNGAGYPVYGSTSKLDNNAYYDTTNDLRGYLKITPDKEVYIQGNQS